MNYLYAVLIWYTIGFFVMRRFEGGWLIMVTDRRNTHQQWLTFPGLFATWTLWPICTIVARLTFFLALHLDALKREREREDYDFSQPFDHSNFLDQDINSMYWHSITPPVETNDEQRKV